jgi:hypothetical protein
VQCFRGAPYIGAMFDASSGQGVLLGSNITNILIYALLTLQQNLKLMLGYQWKLGEGGQQLEFSECGSIGFHTQVHLPKCGNKYCYYVQFAR